MDTVVERSKQLLTLDNCFFGYPPEIIKTELIEKNPLPVSRTICSQNDD
jgi:hypothetical protein